MMRNTDPIRKRFTTRGICLYIHSQQNSLIDVYIVFFLNRLNYTYYAIYIVGIHYKSKSKSIKTRENNPYSQKIDPFNEYNHNKIQEKRHVDT